MLGPRKPRRSGINLEQGWAVVIANQETEDMLDEIGGDHTEWASRWMEVYNSILVEFLKRAPSNKPN